MVFSVVDEDGPLAARQARAAAAKQLREVEGREERVDVVVEGLRALREEDNLGEAIERAITRTVA